MRWLPSALTGTWLLFAASSAHADEKGLIIRTGDLMAQPFLDAAKTSAVTPNQPVTILERRGGWASVESNGQKGWVRLLNVRLEPRAGAGNGVAARPSANPGGGLSSLLRTGSSGRTVTTGVKGMDEEDIRNATPDYAQLEELGTISVDPAAARADAQKNGLKENTVNYLDKGRGR